MSWSFRALRAFSIAIVGLGLLGPGIASARPLAEPTMYADLDGKPIALVEVGDHYCHDLDFPAIHCFANSKSLELHMGSVNNKAGATAATSTGVYVTVYEYATYQGSYMHMSQNYTCLSCIGWNDRISSFAAKNSQSGNFYTDWFYGGTVYGFCCNHELPSLGGYDNTFSSVYRF
jgi:hypothetical protein